MAYQPPYKPTDEQLQQRVYTDPTREPIRAATKRLQLILDTSPDWLNDGSYILSTNQPLYEAQQFLRNHLQVDLQDLITPIDDILADEGLTALTADQATGILEDLRTIWADEFSRDTLSQWAINLSLCPMHFCDWAACFDDDDPECEQIRAIFPYSHDT